MTSETRVFRTPLLETAQRHENLAAGFLLLVFTLLAAWDLVANGIVVGKDTVTQYYPWYAYLGESLRSGEIPAWNPYQFSGAPFAADPLSGWTYLPAMIMFTILPVSLPTPSRGCCALTWRAPCWRRWLTSSTVSCTGATRAARPTLPLLRGCRSRSWARSWRSGAPAGWTGASGAAWEGWP